MSKDNEIPLDPSVLSASGLRDIVQAQKNLDLISARLGAESSAMLPGVLAALCGAGDPDMALNGLERFIGELDPASSFAAAVSERPRILDDLIVLFGASRFLAAFCAAPAGESLGLLRNPAYLSHPADREVLADRLAASLRDVRSDQDL